MTLETLTQQVKHVLQLEDSQLIEHLDELTIEVSSESLHQVCKMLCKELHFAQLIDLCAVDYLHYGQGEWETNAATHQGFSRARAPLMSEPDAKVAAKRFVVVYHLLSIKNNQRLRVKSTLDSQEPIAPTVTDIWPVANWYEREAFDLYGILFAEHPDLRRILTDYGFVGHPMRKDFPLSGHVEVRYCPEKKRVIYQEVSIPPRVLVPKVIRHPLTQGESHE